MTTAAEDNGRTTPCIIREAEIDDLPAIFHLGEELFTSQDLTNLYRTWDEYEVTNMFNLNGEYMLVAEIDEKIAGFVMGSFIEKSQSSWRYGYLVWMGVDPQYRGHRIGTRLFDNFKRRMKKAGARILLVDTQADNTRALGFFKDRGFINPTDHVYLTLNLDD